VKRPNPHSIALETEAGRTYVIQSAVNAG
jgi:hypothetical protein